MDNKNIDTEVSTTDKLSSNQLTGFGGWMYFLSIALILSFGQSAYYFVDIVYPVIVNNTFGSFYDPTSQYYDPTLLAIFIVEIYTNIIILCVIVAAGFLCYKQKRIFVNVLKSYFILIIAFDILTFLAYQIPIDLDYETIGSAAYILHTCIHSSLWTLYLLRSKRIKNTFVL